MTRLQRRNRTKMVKLRKRLGWRHTRGRWWKPVGKWTLPVGFTVAIERGVP